MALTNPQPGVTGEALPASAVAVAGHAVHPFGSDVDDIGGDGGGRVRTCVRKRSFVRGRLSAGV